MFGGRSIRDEKPYMGQNGRTCARCGGNGWLKRYVNKAEWYSDLRPSVKIENFQCSDCNGFGYIKHGSMFK